MLDKIAESCRYLLKNYPEAQICQTYLDSRINTESQDKFEFGYFPGIKNIQTLSTLVGEELLERKKLLYTKNIEDSLYPRKIPVCYFEDYPLIIPFKNATGKVVGLVGRTLLDEKERKIKGIPKYKNTTPFAKGRFLFGLFENKEHILAKDSVYIVEGQFDVIKATEKGFNNIVAIGSASMTSYQFSVISRYTSNIFLLLDNDEAGNKGRKRIMEKFGSFANIKNFYLSESYKDVDEYLSNSDLEEMELIVKD
jgi:DNA primase catalytic core